MSRVLGVSLVLFAALGAVAGMLSQTGSYYVGVAVGFVAGYAFVLCLFAGELSLLCRGGPPGRGSE